jgi:putative endonuclease
MARIFCILSTQGASVMADHNKLGRRGEEIAVSHLLANSYAILETNWRCGRLEVDIIARLRDELIVAEVKTRMAGFLVPPLDAVNNRKQKVMIRAANAYICRTGLNLEIRFDIITVVFTGKAGFTVNHIENAFYPLLSN